MDRCETLFRVLDLAAALTGLGRESLSAAMAIDQDMGIAGDDVTDFAEALAGEDGEWVWSWPWHRFAQLDEGLSPLWPFMLVWQLVTWPVREQFSYASPYERLEPGHFALVIDKGESIEP